MARSPYVFKTPAEALAALAKDKLGTVYYKADGIFVATAFGTGTFTWAEWRKADGPGLSVAGVGKCS